MPDQPGKDDEITFTVTVDEKSLKETKDKIIKYLEESLKADMKAVEREAKQIEREEKAAAQRRAKERLRAQEDAIKRSAKMAADLEKAERKRQEEERRRSEQLEKQRLNAIERIARAREKSYNKQKKEAKDYLGEVIEQGKLEKITKPDIPVKTDFFSKLKKAVLENAQAIRSKTEKDKNATETVTRWYETYRKAITGVLIDLHWLRILGQSSNVLANMFNMINRAIGYIIDMLLIDFYPIVVKITQFLYEFGHAIRQLPAPIKKIFTSFAAGVVVFTGLMTIIAWVTKSFAELAAATALLTTAKQAETAATTQKHLQVLELVLQPEVQVEWLQQVLLVDCSVY